MLSQAIGLDALELAVAFPFHFVLDRQLHLVQLGQSLSRLMGPLRIGEGLLDHFAFQRPAFEPSFEGIAAHQNSLFVLSALSPAVLLRGQFMHLRASDTLVFLGSPWVTDLNQLSSFELSMSDFAVHDPLTDFLVLLQSKNIAFAEAAQLADTLELKRRELGARNDALEESERRYRSVVDNVKEVIFQTDAQGRWTLLNRAWTELTGFEVGASLGTPFLEYVHPDDRARNLDLFRPLIERRKEFCRHSVRYGTADGRYLWFEVYARLTLDDKDEIIGTSGTLNDVTDRYEAEEALRQSEARFQAFMDNSPVLAFIKDADGRLVYANRPMIRRFGPDASALLGKTNHELWPLGTAQAVHEHDALVLAGDEVVSLEESLPAPADDKVGWLSFKFPLSYANGERMLACIAVDMSERKYYERQLEAYQVQLEGMIASLEQVALIDPLTNTFNKATLARQLEENVERASRYGLPLSLLMLDVDRFKLFNDAYGHPAGDEVLRVIGKILRLQARSSDHVARFGGEEFAVVMPNTPIEGAFIVAERIRRAVEAATWAQRRVTVSIGVAALDAQLRDGAALMAAADTALYDAKAAGRNRVSRAKPKPTSQSRGELPSAMDARPVAYKASALGKKSYPST